MNKREAENRERLIACLAEQGLTRDECDKLIRCERTLHRWAEHECNGNIQRNEDTGTPFWYNDKARYIDPRDPRAWWRIPDRETGAKKRASKIASARGLTAYFQGDPRGCALYLLRPGDVPDGKDPHAYYSRGIAVCF